MENIFAKFQTAGGMGLPFNAERWGYNGKTDKKSFGKSLGSDADGNKIYEDHKQAMFLVLYRYHALTKDGFGRQVTSEPFLNMHDEVRFSTPQGSVMMSYTQAKEQGLDKLGRFRTYYVGYVLNVDGKQVTEPTVAVFSTAGNNLYEASKATNGLTVPYLLTVENTGRTRKSKTGEGGTLDYKAETLPQEQEEAMMNYIGDTVKPLLKHFESMSNLPEAKVDTADNAPTNVGEEVATETTTVTPEPAVVTENASAPVAPWLNAN